MTTRYAWMTAFLVSSLAMGEAEAQTGAVAGTLSVDRGRPEGAVVLLVPEGGGLVAPLQEPVIIDQVNLRFIPQVVAVPAGTTVAFPNSDPFMHNVFSPRGPGDGFNLGTYPPGETRARRFTEIGMHVILCEVHPEMVAYVAAVPSPYFALVGEDGGFSIEGLPGGHYTLHAWHGRRPEIEREVLVPAGAVVRLDLLLPAGR